MAPFSLYDKTSTFGGVYIVFLANRLQVLYLILVLPAYLVHPFMIGAIIAIGICSHINLIMLSKWFSSDYSAMGYPGFVQLLGRRAVRLFAFAGLFLMFIKITVSMLGYVEIIHQFLFPSMNTNWLILFIFLTGCYLASHGMEKAIRFVIIAFLCTFWMFFIFIPFYTPPIAALSDLFPLIPTQWSMHSWKSLLFIWSSLSGSEYLICLSPWISPQPKMMKYLTLANAISVFEYLCLFVASLFFYGSNYLSKSKFPVVNMLRYLQSPVFERVDLIMICIDMFHLVLVISIFLLCFYGAARIAAQRLHAQTTRIGFITSCVTILAGMMIIDQWFWRSGTEQSIWFIIQIWLGAFTYLLVPAFLLIAVKRKGRV